MHISTQMSCIAHWILVANYYHTNAAQRAVITVSLPNSQTETSDPLSESISIQNAILVISLALSSSKRGGTVNMTVLWEKFGRCVRVHSDPLDSYAWCFNWLEFLVYRFAYACRDVYPPENFGWVRRNYKLLPAFMYKRGSMDYWLEVHRYAACRHQVAYAPGYIRHDAAYIVTTQHRTAQ